MSWAVISTRPKQELRVVEKLNVLDFVSFAPVFNEEDKENSDIKPKNFECIFPNYVFININNAISLMQIYSVDGVRFMITENDKTLFLPDGFVNEFQNDGLKANKSISNLSLINGIDNTRIYQSPFSGIRENIVKLTPHQRVRLMFDLLSEDSLTPISNEMLHKLVS